MDRLILGQVSVQVLLFPRVCVIPPVPYALYSSIYTRRRVPSSTNSVFKLPTLLCALHFQILKCLFLLDFCIIGRDNVFFSCVLLLISVRIHGVIQEESAILWEMRVCMILSKKVHMNMGPILNGYRDMVKRRYGPSCEHEQQLRNK